MICFFLHGRMKIEIVEKLMYIRNLKQAINHGSILRKEPLNSIKKIG